MSAPPSQIRWSWIGPWLVGLALVGACGRVDDLEGIGGAPGGAGGSNPEPPAESDAALESPDGPAPSQPMADGGPSRDTSRETTRDTSRDTMTDGGADLRPGQVDAGADARGKADTGPADVSRPRDSDLPPPAEAGTPPDTADLPTELLPDNEYCRPVSAWNPAWATLEAQILPLMNAIRARGASCGGKAYPAVPAVTMDPARRCAARAHSKDMVDRSFFDHTNPSGEGPSDRITRAGYRWRRAGENLAAGNVTAQKTMDQWMSSPGHCTNIMSAGFHQVGVGYYPGGTTRHYWTQTFGAR